MNSCAALVLVAFALGCQESPNDTTGPDFHHRAGHDGGGPGGGGNASPNATIEADGSFNTPSGEPQPVQIGKDSPKKLSVHTGGLQPISIGTDFDDTIAASGLCTSEGNAAGLSDLLVQGIGLWDFVMDIDKRNATSDGILDHRIVIHRDVDGKEVRVILAGGPTVTTVQRMDGSRAFTFEGGTVSAQRSARGAGQRDTFSCPVHADDPVTVVLEE